MAKVRREDKLSGEYQKEIYSIISNKVKDPNITEMFSILRAEVTNDLKHAKVYLSIFSKNEEKKQKTFDAIVNARGFIRHELSQIMRMRTVPELHFTLDSSLEYGEKVTKLLNQIGAEKNEN